MAGWHGTAMLCDVTPKKHFGLPNAEDVRLGKIAVHAAVIARHRLGGSDRDDELSRALYNLVWNEKFELSFDLEWVKEYYDETLPADIHQ